MCLAQVTHSGHSLQVIPNLALKDSAGQSVLGLALWAGNRLEIAGQLLSGGANVNDTDSEGSSLLLQAISQRDVNMALFLLRNQADPNARQVCCALLKILQEVPPPPKKNPSSSVHVHGRVHIQPFPDSFHTRVRRDPGKVWIVMELKGEIFQVWKIMENDHRYGKVMESDC